MVPASGHNCVCVCLSFPPSLSLPLPRPLPLSLPPFPSLPPSLCLIRTGIFAEATTEPRSVPQRIPLPPPPAFIKFLRLSAKELVRFQTGTIIKGAYLLSTRSIEETQQSRGLATPDMSGQAMGTCRWAQSASVAFLAKLLLAWVPLERRLRGSVLLSLLITESVSPCKHVCSGREQATSDRQNWAVCLLQSGPAQPSLQRKLGAADPQGQQSPLLGCPEVALTAVPLIWAFIHSLSQSFIHLRMCARARDTAVSRKDKVLTLMKCTF